MSDLKLGSTSYLVLGLAAVHGPVTSYELKQRVQISIGYFWSFPHSQLYAEPERLVEAGLLRQQQESGGRRRRRFTITPKGRKALSDWLAEPVDAPSEIRDLGLLKLFFGSLAEPGRIASLAAEKRRAHRQRRAEYEALWQEVHDSEDPHVLETLEMGLRFEAMSEQFWSEVERGRAPARRRRA
jgi:DNA-binding PadR family transcriptional regulator